jgi:hypothetical protein
MQLHSDLPVVSLAQEICQLESTMLPSRHATLSAASLYYSLRCAVA